MRALKVLVVVMGVLIIGGTATLIAVIAHRMAAPGAAPGAPPVGTRVAVPGAPVGAVSGDIAAGTVAPFARRLDEPEGTRITGMTAAADRLAVALQGGGGPDRIVLIDPRDGRVTGRLRIGR